jgi:hypothetical protein
MVCAMVSDGSRRSAEVCASVCAKVRDGLRRSAMVCASLRECEQRPHVAYDPPGFLGLSDRVPCRCGVWRGRIGQDGLNECPDKGGMGHGNRGGHGGGGREINTLERSFQDHAHDWPTRTWNTKTTYKPEALQPLTIAVITRYCGVVVFRLMRTHFIAYKPWSCSVIRG